MNDFAEYKRLPADERDALGFAKWQENERCGGADAASASVAGQITEQDAHDMGAKGAPATDAERLLFEAWMRGHCWALSATWDGNSYRSDAEQSGDLDPRAMATRRIWAAWRDRAALCNVATPALSPAAPADAAQRQANARDAARYRWIKRHYVRTWVSQLPGKKGAKSVELDFEAEGDDIDAAIDATMATAGKTTP